MLYEYLRYLVSPASLISKKMGYLKESIAIDARYKRQKKAWTNHLDQCHKYIIQYTKMLPPKSKIMFLGSGALYDIPTKHLIKKDLKLQFVDLVHLSHIKKLYKNNSNITFIEHDISEFTDRFYNNHETIPPHPSNDLFEKYKPDFVISINLLSQLSLNFEKYASKNNIELAAGFADKIITAHILWLKGSKINTLIISDMERHYNKNGNVTEIEEIIPDKLLSSPDHRWKWHIAPKGEINQKTDLTHIVALWKI